MSDQILAKTNATIDTSLKSLSNWRFVASLMLAAVCWGFGTVMSKSVLAQVPPLTLLVVQLAVSLTFLWTIIAAQRLRVPLHRGTWRLGLTGLLNPGLAYTLGLLGLTLTTASLSSLIWAAEPILILGLACFVFAASSKSSTNSRTCRRGYRLRSSIFYRKATFRSADSSCACRSTSSLFSQPTPRITQTAEASLRR
jgi:uncharacterized membrane protein